MLAIRFIPANERKILFQGFITAKEFYVRMDDHAAHEALFGKHYIVDRYVTQFGVDTRSWAILSEQKLVDEFDFDASKIEYTFTPIRRKPEKEL